MKGSAYVMASLPPARGRYVGDVDLMVPRERIDEVEQRLLERGWQASELDDYDQRYYRESTHEIPPLQHPERDTPLDIHHTIVPLTSRARPDAQALLDAGVPFEVVPGVSSAIAAPATMLPKTLQPRSTSHSSTDATASSSTSG